MSTGHAECKIDAFFMPSVALNHKKITIYPIWIQLEQAFGDKWA
jgi:hypothetical protein